MLHQHQELIRAAAVPFQFPHTCIINRTTIGGIVDIIVVAAMPSSSDFYEFRRHNIITRWRGGTTILDFPNHYTGRHFYFCITTLFPIFCSIRSRRLQLTNSGKNTAINLIKRHVTDKSCVSPYQHPSGTFTMNHTYQTIIHNIHNEFIGHTNHFSILWSSKWMLDFLESCNGCCVGLWFFVQKSFFGRGRILFLRFYWT